MGAISAIKKHKVMAVIVLLLLVIGLMVFGTRLWLYAKFLLGNDVLIQLSPSQSYISLPNGQETEIEFKTTVTANPFCEAKCSSEFFEVSANRTIIRENFAIKGERSVIKSYVIKAYRLGEGQDVYEFKVECHGISSLLCDTSSELKARSAIITVAHTLNSSEIMLKEKANASFSEIRNKILAVEQKTLSANATLEGFKRKLAFSAREDLASLIDAVNEHRKQLLGLKATWDIQDYYLLDREIDFVSDALSETERESSALASELMGNITKYNSLIDKLNATKELLASLDSSENIYSAARITAAGTKLYAAIEAFASTMSLDEKQSAVALEDTTGLAEYADDILRNKTLEREISNEIFSEVLCSLTGNCRPHSSIAEMVNKTNFRLQDACSETEILRQEYTGNETGNVTLEAKWVLQNASNILVPDGLNSEILKRALIAYDFSLQPIDYNVTTELLNALAEMLPDKCPEYTPLNLSNEIPEKLSLAEENASEAAVFLEEPSQKCCVLGSCQSCCEGCETENYPVIFLHGHVFSKDTSAEYTLDAFSSMQDRFENSGYIDFGTLAIELQPGIPYGVWGKEPLPISITASYYFDIYHNPHGYNIVQIKSESIETYSIRLKDIIDEVKRRTGKQKVSIVAHSMGGLVARKYIQLFERQDVDKLILLTVPNNGIDANTAQYCSFFGESLECNDMNSQSLFINKLKNGKMPNIPITNVIGSGCITRGKMGDGVLTVEEAWLEGANNLIINGTCGQIRKLHGDILNADLYPKAFNITINALKNET